MGRRDLCAARMQWGGLFRYHVSSPDFGSEDLLRLKSIHINIILLWMLLLFSFLNEKQKYSLLHVMRKIGKVYPDSGIPSDQGPDSDVAEILKAVRSEMKVKILK